MGLTPPIAIPFHEAEALVLITANNQFGRPRGHAVYGSTRLFT